MTNNAVQSGFPGWRRLALFLEAIKFEHSVFALPFAILSAFLSANGTPDWIGLAWVLFAMVGMRTFGMAANRLIDAGIDARNPRTASRAIPAGTISRKAMTIYMAVAGLIFVGATSQLDPVTWALAPIPLAVMIGYPYLKRFTWFAHFGMGAVYLIVPPAVSLALTGTMPFGFVVIGIGSMAWVAGFDVLYATADYEVDREQGLHSIPARFGIPVSLVVSRSLHASSITLLAVAGGILETKVMYLVGVLVAAFLLAYEQSLVSSSDLSKLNTAFFTMNGVIAVVFGVFVVIGEVI
ncbi:MAG TPA: UbiA-like polyprenyltransferase [Dehalococcoidia bacterium]|jgi:4-hydroxybenzoate polyprenyltransferase|nr:4-hydroxybenzoate octaprenyltransferase [Chloroflexota bacterium]MDP6056131.1 UbiA-like polyprenyltransferase [Dehalococcoidia bacterium]MDP7262551.1 UbiA-like polyprenyltransferase [Dehalococcoidia bacterium]MDP7485002.1 UbiA-like polyprenyltransferase [Dehalococcoidia bacterium]HJP27637.1 UbiA-like polyprenyltransferase [Dehalococcoidia bacterium]|tara:strand:+ start:143 stop:1027 length:885 start_codon:yes stop_codon:yes gene_type:complete